MERCKVILRDRLNRRTALLTVLTLLAFILIGQLMVLRVTQDYKTAMLSRDRAVAGYLSRNGADGSLLKAAFTLEKTEADLDAGAALLLESGYDEFTKTSLLPEADAFYRSCALFVLSLSAFLSLAVLAILAFGALSRDKELINAANRLRRFLDGDTAVRLPDCREGTLSQLFLTVNSMATSLTAHIEKEKRNKEFLKEMISDISHQLKTPLSALSMYNEIIMDEASGNSVIKRFTEKNRREHLRMETLIRNLLTLSKLDAGTIELQKSVSPLRGFLERCASSFSVRAEEEGKQIDIFCPDTAVLCFDELWLGEALGNIIKNALDHTAAGDRIEIICNETASALEILVKDTGSGIHPEDIHHVFKRFYRSRFSKDKQGVGIGLSLSKAVVERHDGVVSVRSEPGKGAEFCLAFPKLTKL